ncbi:MAG: hypothetical protein ACRD1B_02940 [Thermoanaerobaculia bacterium]
MKQITLRFEAPERTGLPGDDGVTYRFPFRAVDSELVGSPEEARVTARHRLTVQAVRSRTDGWRLSDSDLVKELFEIGRRELLERATRGPLQAEEKVIVNSKTHGSTPPFDPARIPEPNGFTVTAEPAPRRIGF